MTKHRIFFPFPPPLEPRWVPSTFRFSPLHLLHKSLASSACVSCILRLGPLHLPLKLLAFAAQSLISSAQVHCL